MTPCWQLLVAAPCLVVLALAVTKPAALMAELATLTHAARTVAVVAAAVSMAGYAYTLRIARRLRSAQDGSTHQRWVDSLTGLPNRHALVDRLAHATAPNGTSIGLVLVDLDRFKDINNSVGHDQGDEILAQVASRLRDEFGEHGFVARAGSDEFAILLPIVRGAAHAGQVAHRVHDLFGAPFMAGDVELHIDGSVGVAHAADGSVLMHRADVAMHAAKTHRLGVSTYCEDQDSSSLVRLVLLSDLHHALTRTDELALHYQPKVDLTTGAIVGVEALMRWRHPTRGMVSPGLFVPLAEQTGLINDLTRFALRTAIAQVAAWRAAGFSLPVAVNLSALDVTTFAVVDAIESLLTQHDVPAELLEVEVTETALVADPSQMLPVLNRLGEMGVRVSIDDFGTGTTSISQLRTLQFAHLKIDQVFVADMRNSPDQAGPERVVKVMVDLAHSFDLLVIAEGVEDPSTAARLAALGVDQAQGFLYSRAVPASQVPHLRVGAVPAQRRSGRPLPAALAS